VSSYLFQGPSFPKQFLNEGTMALGALGTGQMQNVIPLMRGMGRCLPDAENDLFARKRSLPKDGADP